MCTRMYCESMRQELTSIRDLESFIPDESIVLLGDYAAPPEAREGCLARLKHACLCMVDLPASFAGDDKWRLEPEDNMPGDWLIVPKYGTAGG